MDMSPLEVALTNKRLPEGGLNLLLHNLHLRICGIPVETRYTDHLCDGEIASMIGCIAIPKWKSALLRFSRYTVMFFAQWTKWNHPSQLHDFRGMFDLAPLQ